VSPTANLKAIAEALERGGNRRFTVKELPGLNHLFQTADTGAPSEYSKIEETISPTALELISTWILRNTTAENVEDLGLLDGVAECLCGMGAPRGGPRRCVRNQSFSDASRKTLGKTGKSAAGNGQRSRIVETTASRNAVIPGRLQSGGE
jgi:hypothetical protein